LNEEFASVKVDPTTFLSRPAQAAPPYFSRRNENLTSPPGPVKDARTGTAALPQPTFLLTSTNSGNYKHAFMVRVLVASERMVQLEIAAGRQLINFA